MSEAVDPRDEFVALPPGPRDTVIVAAEVGWTEYQSSGAYICWPGQGFWEKVTHFGFYAYGEIKPVIARVRAWHDEVLLTAAEAASRRAEGDTELAAAIDFFLAQRNRDEAEYYGIILLSHPEDPDTVRLAAPIVNDKASWSGRRTAWTQRFSYTSLASLTNGFTYTSSLDDDFKRRLASTMGDSHGRGDVGGHEEEGDSQTALSPDSAAEPGEVILQVWRTDSGGYSFQLIGEQLHQPEIIDQLDQKPREVARKLINELRAISEGGYRAQYGAPSFVRDRLENLGTMLWADVVPVSIREQFWAQRDKIRSLTIISNVDTMPWELLYPNDSGHDCAGFLVEQFPVVRRLYGQARVRTLQLDRGAGFIVLPKRAGNALDEVADVRAAFPAGVPDRGTETSYAAVHHLLKADTVPSVLHFAGHSAFKDETEPEISLEGGRLRPSDLSGARQQRAFKDVRPLVFFNGCHTAEEVAGLTRMTSWASNFMSAGAGAFIGTLWTVRSETSRTFAAEFYRALISDGLSLGAASLRARQALAPNKDDPTWLAYTIYGDPAAFVAPLSPGRGQ